MAKSYVDTQGLSKKLSKLLSDSVEDTLKYCESYAMAKLNDAYNNRGFQNDNFNLRDSYCYSIYHNGKEKRRGYLGSPVATRGSRFHGRLINGRQEADEFLSGYQPTVMNGYEIVLAAAAPYAGILESGWRGYQYIVMSYIYDSVRRDFGDARVKVFIDK